MPYSTQLNPPLWEAGHVAWFQDYWVARNQQRGRGVRADPEHARPDGRLPQADALYNSSHVPHDTRWALPLPDLSAHPALSGGRPGRDTGPARRHPGNRRRPVFLPPRAVSRGHARRSRGLHGAGARTFRCPPRCSPRRKPCRRTATLQHPGASSGAGPCRRRLRLRQRTERPQAVDLAAVRDRQPAFVSWARYLPFLEATGAAPPRYVRRHGDTWQGCLFGDWEALPLDAPATHLSWFEADAWCRWAGPSPAERSRMGSGGADATRLSLGPGLGMDGQPLPALPRLRRPPLPRLFRALVRRALRPARRQPGDFAAHGAPALPQLLHRRNATTFTAASAAVRCKRRY